MRKKIVAANWKMNMTQAEAAAFDVRSAPVHDLTPAPTLAELNGAIREDAGPVQAA